VKLVGAAYLVFLGLQALRTAWRHGRDARGASAVAAPVPRLRTRAALRQGLISNLSNPKMAAFFPALLPQFAPEGEATFLVLALLGLTFSLMTLVWLATYAAVVASAGDLVRRPRIRRAFEAVTGAVLVALGLRLATEDR
jgi:threonine/homoserine/homoserine lactone efflux protein